MLQPAFDTLAKGEAVVLVDDVSTNPVSYLVAPAASITDKTISRMVNFGKSVIMAAVSDARLSLLGLGMMSSQPGANAPEMTISVEARQGVTTGISAADRARTLDVLATTTTPLVDLVTPGHIFPLRAKKGGLLVRSGIAEATTDLLTLAGLPDTAALCHCLNNEGAFADQQHALQIAAKLSCPVVSISEILKYRLAEEKVVTKVASAKLPIRFGESCVAHCFVSSIDESEHLALVWGDIDQNGDEPIAVRVHAESKISDLLDTTSPRGRESIRHSLSILGKEAKAVFVYIRHPIKAGPHSSNDPSSSGSIKRVRELGVGSQILSSLGVKKIKLLTNSNSEFSGLDAYGIELVSRIPLQNNTMIKVMRLPYDHQ